MLPLRALMQNNFIRLKKHNKTQQNNLKSQAKNNSTTSGVVLLIGYNS